MHNTYERKLHKHRSRETAQHTWSKLMVNAFRASIWTFLGNLWKCPSVTNWPISPANSLKNKNSIVIQNMFFSVRLISNRRRGRARFFGNIIVQASLLMAHVSNGSGDLVSPSAPSNVSGGESSGFLKLNRWRREVKQRKVSILASRSPRQIRRPMWWRVKTKFIFTTLLLNPKHLQEAYWNR